MSLKATGIIALALGWALAASPVAAAVSPALQVERAEFLWETDTQSARDAVCRQVSREIVLDGNLDDWRGMQALALDRREQTEAPRAAPSPAWGGPADLSAKIYLAWDLKYLYLAADVTDKVVIPATNVDPSQGDAVVLYVDARGDSTAQEGPDDLEFTLILLGKQAATLIPTRVAGQRPKEAVALPAAASIRSDGYVVETAIPWSRLAPLTPVAQRSCGFGVLVRDRDTAEGPATQWLETCPGVGRRMPAELGNLVFAVQRPPSPEPFLYLTRSSIHTNEDLLAVFAVNSPEPLADLRLSVEVRRVQPDPGTIYRITPRVDVGSGINRYLITWTPHELPTGEYRVQAALTSATGQALTPAQAGAVNVAPAYDLAALSQYRETLSTESVLARLAATPPPPEGFTFAVAGDIQGGLPILEQVLRQMKARASFGVLLGDLVADGYGEQYQELAPVMAGSGLPLLTIVGNHDVIHDGRAIYHYLFGPTDYTFDYGGARFILMDSTEGGFTEAQLAWLEEKLNTDLRKLVFFHLPTAGGPGATPAARSADRVLALLQKHKVDYVFTGHRHGYAREDIGGLRWIITGGSGGGLPRGADYNFVVVRVGPTGVTDEVFRMAWQPGGTP
jgi:predicted phosphodiesterase